jgi:hypothetical protein
VTENIIGWKLTITAEADTRPGTPEEIELANWRAGYVEQYGPKVLAPDPPAEDETCRECFVWQEFQRTPGEQPGVWLWFATCPPSCAHECHDFDSVTR